MFCRVLATIVVFLSISQNASSSYVITSPRKWVTKAQSQTCISLTDGGKFAAGDSLSLTITEKSMLKKVLVDSEILTPTVGDSRSCLNITLPETDNNKIILELSGSVGTTKITEKTDVAVVKSVVKTYVQTDKALYKPGQTVQFRVLTVEGPFLKVSTKNYSSIYIESPKGTRIGQWLNVDNKNGLIHLKFDLHQESDEGTYFISVELDGKNAQRRSFTVEDYVLPTYEVTITPPPVVLGSDKELVLELCARYTFGQPVKGTANLSVAVGTWTIYNNVTQAKPIDGCTKFTFKTSDLRFDDNNCHIRIMNVRASAKVVESGTKNEIYGENEAIRVHRSVISFESTSPTGHQIKFLPSLRSVRAKFQDGKIAAQEKIEVCTYWNRNRVCKNFTTDAQGELGVMVPNSLENAVEFNAINYPQIERNFNYVMEENIHRDYKYTVGHPSQKHNSSISIFMERRIKCEDGKAITLELPLIYVAVNQASAVVHLQGFSRGQEQFSHSQEVQFVSSPLPFDSAKYLIPLPEVPAGIKRGMVKITITLPTTVSPKMKMLVWFKNSAGVVFADSATLDVSPCLQSSAKLAWSKPKAEPGSPVDLIVTGEPTSLCSIGVVDKSVELLKTLDKMTVGSLLGPNYIYESHHYEKNQQSIEHCLTKYAHTERVKKMKLPVKKETGELDYDAFRVFPPRDHYIEAIHAFNDAGYIVFSDLDMEKELCDFLFTRALKKLSDAKEIPKLGRPIILADSQAGGSKHKISNTVFDEGVPAPQAQAPASFGFAADKEGTVAEEETRERVYFPETWLWELDVIPANGQLTKPQTLPDTITEWIGRAICVNSALGVSIADPSSVITFTPFFTDVTLPPTLKRGETLPVIVSVFNYQNTPLPVTVTLPASKDFEFVSEKGTTESGKRTLCIPPNDKGVVTIEIVAKILGEMNITIDAVTNSLDTACNPNPPVKSDRLIKPIPVEAEGFLREKTWNRYICAQDYAAGEVITPITIDTPASIVAGSDRSWITATGDLLGPSLENLGYLIRFPSGCGEQNMLNLAPNVFILQYLQATKEGDPKTIQKLKDFMKSGYQRQLSYRHPDGSYSSFGDRDLEGSTWLTAFVMKSFAHAKKFIFIDDKIQKASSLYLMGLQGTDGCFESKGRVIHKALQGGVGKTEENSLLTAYVTAAFIESQLDSPENSVVKKALPCINKSTSKHPYNVALKAYVLALAKDPSTKVLDDLIASAVSDAGTMRWDIPDQYKNSALSVETASYALLAMLNIDPKIYKEPAKKVLRWLTSQRNGQGGFKSTQDTIVALQALAFFEELQPSGKVDLALTGKGLNFDQSFIVQETNKILQQRFDLPAGTKQVDLSVQGTGCALAQGVLRYNVLAASASDAFTLTAEVTPSADCKFHTIKACASYTLPDKASNMAIIEVNLPTGFAPIREDLRTIVGTPSFKRYEVKNLQIVFYLDEITATQVCASFKIKKELNIGNLKPGSVRVYDYYQPEFLSETSFSINDGATCAVNSPREIETETVANQ